MSGKIEACGWILRAISHWEIESSTVCALMSVGAAAAAAAL
jgi:hypothetical protein